MSDVHQCPFCELRFAAKWELEFHLGDEHPGRVTPKDRSGVTIEEPERPE